MSEEHKPKLFMSYCWEDDQIAEKIYKDLTQVGIILHKDNHELKFKDSIRGFMNSIRDFDYAILLISNSYLKSKNCLYEISQLIKEKDFHKKVLPIILDSAKIYSTQERLYYLNYWLGIKTELELSLKDIDPINAIEAHNDLKSVTEITLLIDSFLKDIGDMLHITLSKLQKQYYKPLLEKVGYVDISFATELIEISKLKDIETKELALDMYLSKYGPNTYYYSIKGSTYSAAQKFKQAEFNYLESIKLDPNNFAALNNLGYLYHYTANDYGAAKLYYEKAINVNPELTEARLNLGVLLSDKFADYEAAKEQYDIILKYNPNEPKAHNNIRNYYKRNLNFAKAEYHLKRALELNPNYIDWHINYGNLLKITGRTEEGNKMYEKAKTLTNDKDFLEFIDTLIQSTKG